MRPALWRARVKVDARRLLTEMRIFWDIENIRPLNVVSWNALFEAVGVNVHGAAKVYNPGDHTFEGADPLLVARVCHALHNHGFLEVVPPIPTATGALVANCMEYRVVLYEWVRGIAAQRQHIARCAEVLAALNSVNLAGLESFGLGTPRRFNPTIQPDEWITHQDTIWDTARRRIRAVKANAVDELQLNEGRALASCLARDYPEFFQTSTKRLLHGDFRPSNILVKKNNDIRILDFDCLQVGMVEVDVATAALAFAGAEWLSGKADDRVVVQFIEAYRTASVRHGFDVDHRLLLAALPWVPLRALSAVFKPEQIPGRLELARRLASRPPLQ